MAKRNIRKTDPDTVTSPDTTHDAATTGRREASAADPNGRAAAPKASRSRPGHSRRDTAGIRDQGDPDYSRGRDRDARGGCECNPRAGSAPHARIIVVVHDGG